MQLGFVVVDSARPQTPVMIGAIIIVGMVASVLLCVWIFSHGGPTFLVKAVTTLPASAFPERANVYTCDKCGRDVTKHFHLVRGHVWSPMGPIRFTCRCGERYLTGATEWDYLGAGERRRRIGQTLFFSLLFSAMSSIFATLVYLLLRFVFDLRQTGFILALLIATFPFVLMQLTFWPGVVSSIWRTRIGTSVERG